MNIFCPNCGKKNDSINNYCFACGSDIRKFKEETNEQPQSNMIPSATIVAESHVSDKDLPTGIILLSIIIFITSFLWIVIGFSQGMISEASVVFDSDGGSGTAAFYNVLMGLLGIAVGVGLLKLKYWSYQVGKYSAIIGIVWYFYLAISVGSVFFFWLLIILEIITLIILLNFKSYFVNPDTEHQQGEEHQQTELNRRSEKSKSLIGNIIVVGLIVVFVFMLFAYIFIKFSS